MSQTSLAESHCGFLIRVSSDAPPDAQPNGDQGPLWLQEILLAGCPTVGVQTGASFVRDGITGAVVDRPPPGRACIESDDNEACLAAFMDAVEKAATMDRDQLRSAAVFEFDASRIVDSVLDALKSSACTSVRL